MNDLKALLKRQIKAPPTILAWRKLSSRLQIIALSMTSKNWFLFTLKKLIFIYFREALMPPALSPALLGEGGVEIHKNPWKSMEISFRSCHPCRIFIKLFWIMAKPPWFWNKAVAGHSWSLFSRGHCFVCWATFMFYSIRWSKYLNLFESLPGNYTWHSSVAGNKLSFQWNMVVSANTVMLGLIISLLSSLYFFVKHLSGHI